MPRIIAETHPPHRSRYIKRAFTSIAALTVIGTAATAQLLSGDFEETVTTARAQIEECTIRGVGAAITNGSYTLSLPAGCRLAG